MIFGMKSIGKNEQPFLPLLSKINVPTHNLLLDFFISIDQYVIKKSFGTDWGRSKK